MEKIEPQTSHMNCNLEASSDIRDTDVEKDLLAADLTVESPAQSLKAAAGSTENNPEDFLKFAFRTLLWVCGHQDPSNSQTSAAFQSPLSLSD